MRGASFTALLVCTVATSCGGSDGGTDAPAGPDRGGSRDRGQLSVEQRNPLPRGTVPHVRVASEDGRVVLRRGFRGQQADGTLVRLRLRPASYVLHTWVRRGGRDRGHCTRQVDVGEIEAVTATVVRAAGEPCTVRIRSISFDGLVGRPVESAVRIARGHGFALRVVERDGEPLIVTEDLRYDRVNVAVEDDRVTAVDGLY